MIQEDLQIYCYGFNAESIPLALFEPEQALTKEEHEYFQLWKDICENISLPDHCHINKSSLPQWIDDQDTYQKGIILLFTSMMHLAAEQTYHQLTSSHLRKISTRNDAVNLRHHPVSYFNFQPIITIGERDIMGLDETAGQVIRNLKDFPAPDPRFKFFDSSIWHRYVPMYKDVKEGNKLTTAADSSDFSQDICALIELMREYHSDNLYATNAARSALELELRLLKESFIERFGNRGHYKAVTPFKFHSESQMAKKAGELIDVFYQEFLGGGKQIKWKFLMVDDYANSPISTFLYNNEEENSMWGADKSAIICSKTKLELIQNLLKELEAEIQIVYPKAIDSKDPFPLGKTEHHPDDPSKTNIIATCCEYLEKDHYDLILLDYLLGRIDNTELREFGHQFLQRLDEDAGQEGLYRRGPYGRFWVFPISSFPYAMHDKLRQLGMNNFNLWWHLTEGCDPISTPQLFRFGLLSFLRHQIKEVLLPPAELNNVINKFRYTSSLQQRTMPKQALPPNANLWAQVVVAELNEILLKIELLKIDRATSAFARSMFKKLSSHYIEMLGQCYKLVLCFCIGFNSEESFLAFYKSWEDLKLKLKDDQYFPVVESITALLNQTGALIDYNNAIFHIEQELEFRDNKISLNSYRLYGLPTILKQASHIQGLNLQSNHLSTLPPYLADFKDLTEINLSANPITEFPEVLFHLQKQLDFLSLEGTHLPERIRITAKGKQEVADLFAIADNIDSYQWIDIFDGYMAALDLSAAANHCIQSNVTQEIDKESIIAKLLALKETEKAYRTSTISDENLNIAKMKLLEALQEVKRSVLGRLAAN